MRSMPRTSRNRPTLSSEVMNIAANTWSVASEFLERSRYSPSPGEPPTHSPMVAATTL